MSLFEKYGGFATISKIGRAFYKDVMASPTLKPYFKNVDMQALMDHQTKFLSHAMGGPAEYTGRSLAAAHRHLDVTHAAFAEVAEILQDNLEDAGMDPADIEAVMGIVGSTLPDIVAPG